MKQRKYVIDPLTGDGIDEMLRGIEEYKSWLRTKSEELLERLAYLGATNASLGFSRAIYQGDGAVDVTAEKTDGGYLVKASGEAVLFIEFGAGVRYGYGHPEAGEYGMGPGTYPDGKGHWNDPRGWYLPKEKGGGHSYGNPPAAAMYESQKTIEREITDIVREVFGLGS